MLVKEQQGKVLWLEPVYLDVTPSSGLICSTNDVGLLMRSLMKADLLLSEESKQSMMPTGDFPAERPLGRAEYQMGEHPYVQHMGGRPGFATIMRLYPQEGLGICILANGTRLEASVLVDLFSGLSW